MCLPKPQHPKLMRKEWGKRVSIYPLPSLYNRDVGQMQEQAFPPIPQDSSQAASSLQDTDKHTHTPTYTHTPGNIPDWPCSITSLSVFVWLESGWKVSFNIIVALTCLDWSVSVGLQKPLTLHGWNIIYCTVLRVPPTSCPLPTMWPLKGSLWRNVALRVKNDPLLKAMLFPVSLVNTVVDIILLAASLLVFTV